MARATSETTRGRRRDPAIDARALSAAVDELAERGIAGFSINNVAVRAEIDKRGIYARWADRDQLIIEALSTLAAGLIPPRTGSLRADLEAIVPAVAAVFTAPRQQILTRCVAEARQHPAVYAGFRRDSIGRCSAVVEDAFWTARHRGEVGGTIEPSRAADAFLGSILTRALLAGDDSVLSSTEQHAIVDYTIATLSPR